ncbi:MAG: PEP-CTERM sorting domain-containing protein [Pirellulales bacterium]|nr:PEP-CTERM sorting domain-containing protein [Pirellulales bacterium]
MHINRNILFAALAVFSLLLVAPASAGVLNGHASALASFTGTEGFVGGVDPNLSGTVDYAVFPVGSFPFSGYTPNAGDNFIYAYQVFSTGTTEVSSLSVVLTNAANSAGTFSLTGNSSAGSITGVPGLALWTFGSGGLSVGENSVGLAFSSPNLPQTFVGEIADGADFASLSSVPSPSSTVIPEPASIAIAGLGGLFALLQRRRK